MVIRILDKNGEKIDLAGVKLIFLKLIPFHSNGLFTYCDNATPNFIKTSITTTETFQKRYILRGSKYTSCQSSNLDVPVGYFFVPVYVKMSNTNASFVHNGNMPRNCIGKGRCFVTHYIHT